MIDSGKLRSRQGCRAAVLGAAMLVWTAAVAVLPLTAAEDPAAVFGRLNKEFEKQQANDDTRVPMTVREREEATSIGRRLQQVKIDQIEFKGSTIDSCLEALSVISKEQGLEIRFVTKGLDDAQREKKFSLQSAGPTLADVLAGICLLNNLSYRINHHGVIMTQRGRNSVVGRWSVSSKLAELFAEAAQEDFRPGTVVKFQMTPDKVELARELVPQARFESFYYKAPSQVITRGTFHQVAFMDRKMAFWEGQAAKGLAGKERDRVVADIRATLTME